MSGRKNRLVKYQNITSGNMASATITSAVTNIEGLDNIGLQLVWTGSPVGTFAFQISADYAQDFLGNVTNTGNWVAISTTPNIAAAGSADTAYVDISQLSAPWIRVVYTKTSGTGTLNGYITAKQL